MTRSAYLLLVGVIVAACVGRSLAADPLNVLLIVSEDNGPQFGCYGDATVPTPHVDALARAGVVFENAYVTQSVCSPSRASILTGLYPHRHGQIGLATHGFALVGDPPNLPTLLKGAGYRTGIIGKLHVNPPEAFAFDLDHNDAEANSFRRRDPPAIAAAAERFMAEGGPFFLMVNLADAHLPFIPQSAGFPREPITTDRVHTLPGVLVDTARLRAMTADYYNCIARIDAAVGALLESLRRTGKAGSTLVIYIADHGPQFARGKVTSYELGVRVPLIVRWPGGPSDRDPGPRAELVSAVDLLPTVLEAAGVDAPAVLDGRSLGPLLRGDRPDPAWREHLFCEWNTSHASPPPSLFAPQRSVRDARYKLIVNLIPGRRSPAELYYTSQALVATGPTQQEIDAAAEPVRLAYRTWRDAPPVELYDLKSDPHETTNLAERDDLAEVRGGLERALDRWRRDTGDPLLDPAKLRLLTEEHGRAASLKGAARARYTWRYRDYLYERP